MDKSIRSQISFRTEKKGGIVKEILSEEEKKALSGRKHIVLLIHGYNNDKKAALEAYNGFKKMQRKIADIELDKPIFDGRVVEVFWPGDADWGVLSPLFYMESIDMAKKTAWLLADALEEAARSSGTKFIDIVAHSMGCRLTLELLGNLNKNSDVFIRRVVLMAGAVPVFKLDPNDSRGKLRKAYNNKLREKALSLYSSDDIVLSMAFPLGQTVAGIGEGFLPTALGHEKWVDDSVPDNLTQKQNESAGHSDYWGWNTKASRQGMYANKEVSDFLHIGSNGSRAVNERRPSERETSQARRLEERFLYPDSESDFKFGYE